ncbi:MAG: hypothetical protein A2Z95_04605 [Gallionellales bacterium GWA2_60_18]|nr:MAG: hypothetical protein A2Z95_04605 [Gallionellales bacterium GWA2_60_18]
MHQQFDVSPEEAKRAKWPHEIFLINLVFNHILVFASTFGVYSTFPLMVLVVPLTSFAITAYIIVKGRQIAAGDETWFVKSHWAICAKRNRYFLLLLSAACLLIGGGYWLSQAMGWSKIATLAMLGGGAILPFMVSLLILIVLGNESVHLARVGRLPKRFVEQNPDDSSGSSR